MQYNQIYNQQAGTNHQNTPQQTKNNPPERSTKPANIFSRNVVNNPIPTSEPVPPPPPTNTNTFNNQNKLTPANNIFTSGTPPISKSVASKDNVFLGGNAPTNQPNPINNLAGNSQISPFNNTPSRITKNDARIFNNNSNNSNSNTLGNSLNSQNSKPFNPTFTNAANNNPFNFQSPQQRTNVFAPSINSQSNNNNQPKQSISSWSQQFNNNNSINPTSNSMYGISNGNNSHQNQGFQNQRSSNPFLSNSFPQQNIYYQFQNSQSQYGQGSLQPPHSTDISILEMMQKIHLNDFKNWNNPYNLYHSKLMLHNIYNRISSSKDERPDFNRFLGLNQIIVKDFPNIDEILIMIKEMKNTSRYIQDMKKKAIQLEKTSDELAESLAHRLSMAKVDFTHKIKWEKMIKEMKFELTLIESELREFVRPLVQSIQGSRHIQFQDPDDFSLEIAKSILQKISLIERNINSVAAESINTSGYIAILEEKNALEARHAIERLIQYFEEICIKFENMKERFEHHISSVSKRSQRDEDNCKSGQLISVINRILQERANKMKNRFVKDQHH